MYKKLFGFLWINLFYLEGINKEYYNYQSDAEYAIQWYCRRAKLKALRPIKVKEISCEDMP